MIKQMKIKKKIQVKNERLLFAVLLIALFIIFILYYNFVFSENGKLVDYPMVFWREIRKRDIDSATETGKDYVYNLGM